MRNIFIYIRTYARETDKWVFAACALFTALLVWINYAQGLNAAINRQPPLLQLMGWFLVFTMAFGLPYLLLLLRKRISNPQPQLGLYFIAACALFSWKMSADLPFDFGSGTYGAYWSAVTYWPFKLAVVTTALLIIAKLGREQAPPFGLQWSHLDTRPYWIMLLIMIPLVAAAATQPDFLHTYPKLKNISFMDKEPMAPLYRLLFEIAYGSDFFTIEVFFRGFLVLGFIRWAGKDAVLPMACFYCTIHFGKPLGECISSFFGGMLLGIVTYHTRSIFGGLIVHLGIAWLMELGGYLGHQLR